ncbi:hypothetical protein BOX15_Mlig027160g2 [Macrostomum lignano]|uniref:Uncharacterized protein n=1 Tax=Macrostomum lignano TaxID=282301 RepID=A0A267EL89_9PLAT|nr:hypothetical protein BOX15_Mlig027160g2 [Macrostomum lignano]
MMANLLMQGDYTRLRSLMDRSNAGATAIFQVADRGCQNNKRSMFHRQAVLYLSLVGLAIYFNKGSAASLLIKEGGAALLRSQFATGVQSSDDILTFPAEYIAVLMESFDCVAPLIRLRFWEPYETSSLLYRRRYLQMRTPIVGYPDLLRCALLRNPNYNLSGFLISARRESTNFSLSRLIYLGSIMVQHFDIDFSASVGIRRTFDATSGPRFVLPNLCSLQRRLLTLAVYQDPNGRLLSQVLAGLKECNQAGAHLVTMLPQAVGGSLLLWLQELVSAEHNGQLFRCLGARTEKLLQSEPDDAFTPRCLRDHYLRYDALNCFSLLLSLLARHKVGRMDSLGFARRIMDAACGISIQAGLAIPLFSYAWPDHLLALASLVNPLTPAGGVGFEEFARLLQHLPGYASAAGYGATDKWRASIRKSILQLNWKAAQQATPELLAGRTPVPLTVNSGAAIPVQVSQEQDADAGWSASEQERRVSSPDYAAFYRQFEQRYRLLASCLRLPASQQPLPLPLAVEFSEDSTFRQALQRVGGSFGGFGGHASSDS